MASSPTIPKTRRLGFPETVDERSARLVASGVVALAVLVLVSQWWLLDLVLVYGFVARVAAGPTFSPLAQVAVRLPRWAGWRPRPVPGPPKRFAQAIGVVFSTTAAVLALGFGATAAASVVLGLLVVAAGLEAAAGVCLGCHVFGWLMRAGIVPEDVCERCNDLWGDRAAASGPA